MFGRVEAMANVFRQGDEVQLSTKLTIKETKDDKCLCEWVDSSGVRQEWLDNSALQRAATNRRPVTSSINLGNF